MSELLAQVRSLAWLMSDVRWDPARPRAAPQFRCHGCGRWIGKRNTVFLVREGAGR